MNETDLSTTSNSVEDKPNTRCEENISHYLRLIAQLEKSVLAFDTFENCLQICQSINEVSRSINDVTLSNNPEKPFSDTNVVILACKHGRTNLLNYILSGDEDILYNVSVKVGQSAVQPDDRDGERRNAFYYAMRWHQTDLIETLIHKWPGQIFTQNPENLDKLLSSALKELKLQNVALSIEVTIFVETVLVDLRFFDAKKPNQPKQKRVFRPEPVLQRIDLVLDRIDVLGSADADDTFMCVLKQVAKCVHVLKRQLRPTYDRIPWEEIEFHLVAFIGSAGKPQELSMFHGSVLSRRKILDVLKNFAECIRLVRNNAADLQGKFQFPKLKRDEMIAGIVSTTSFSKEFYGDFEQLRDFFTLETITKYLKLASSSDARDKHGQLVITRCLQVVGEHLKNTIESPKLSYSTGEVLLAALPSQTAEVLKVLRDSLSHDDSLVVRMDIEENSDSFFAQIQRDLRKLVVTVSAVVFRKKIAHIRSLFQDIIRCESVDEMRELVEARDVAKLDAFLQERFTTVEVDKLESLVHSLRNQMSGETSYEKSLFSEIDRLIQAEKNKLKDIHEDFLEGYTYFSLIILLLKGDSEVYEIKKWAIEASEKLVSRANSPSFRSISHLIKKLWNSIAPKITDEGEDKVRIVWEIFQVLELEMDSVKWIQEFRNQLTKKREPMKKKKSSKPLNTYSDLLLKKVRMLEELLRSNCLNSHRLHQTLMSYQKDEKLQALMEMLLLDIMSIFQCNSRLSENPYFLDCDFPVLLGQNLRKHLAHENALVKILTNADLDVLLTANSIVNGVTEKCDKQTDQVLMNEPLTLRTACEEDLIQIVNQQKLFVALAKGDICSAKACLKAGADIKGKDSNLWTALHFASQGPNVEAARLMLDLGADVNSQDTRGRNSLHVAAEFGRVSTIEFLVDERKMYVDCVDNFKKTALHLSAENGHCAGVEALLRRGASTGAKEAAFNSPLQLAVANNQLLAAEILLDEEIHADASVGIGGFSALHVSVEKGYLEMVRRLLDNGAEVNLRNDEGFTPLHRASLTGRTEIAKLLIFRGAEVSARSETGITPMHAAAKNGHEAVMRLLADGGCDLNASDKSEMKTPLHLAALHGHYRVVDLLLQKGAGVNARALHSQTPLHLASLAGSHHIVHLLMESKAEVDARDDDGMTPLHITACKGNKDVLRSLIENGANVNAQHKIGTRALHIAAVYGHKDVSEILIANRADIDAKDGNGETALHLSIHSGSLEISRLLINNRADVDVSNSLGLKPSAVAALCGHADILQLLISKGACVDSQTLCLASTSGNRNAVQCLIDCGLDVNGPHSGSTPLHEAVRGNHKEVVELLIRVGADANSKNENGFTPLLDAVKCNFKDIVDVLISAGADVDFTVLLFAVNHGGDMLNSLLREPKDDPGRLKEEATLLHAAATEGMKSVAEVLLSRGVSVDAKVDGDVTPLFTAVTIGQLEMVNLFLSKNASTEERTPDGATPLFAASSAGFTKIVEVLLKAGADASVRDDKNRSSMEMAVANGHLGVVRLLLQETDIDVNAIGHSGLSLHIAAEHGQLDIVRFLTTHGADAHSRECSGSEPIHLSAMSGHRDVVEFFLTNGLNEVDGLSVGGQTPLHYAVYGRRTAMMKSLIDNGADVDSADALGSTPSHVAAFMGEKKVLSALLENGACYEARNMRGMTPLQVAKAYKRQDVIHLLSKTTDLLFAVRRKNLKKTEALIRGGAVVNARGVDRVSPLHCASWKGYEDIVDLLLKKKANPNAIGKGGSTPLHYAAKYSHLEIVKALLSSGANHDVRSDGGKTPRHFAQRPSSIAELLDLVDKSFRAVQNGDSCILHELNSKSTDTVKAVLKARNAENRTLLTVAIRNDFPRLDTLKRILQDGLKETLDSANMWNAMEDFPKLLTFFKTLLDLKIEAFGLDSSSALDVREEIALVWHKQHKCDEALRELKNIYLRRKEMVGMGVDLLRTRKNIAFMLFLQNKYQESLKVYREILPKQKCVFGVGDADVFRTQIHIAMITLALGEFNETLKQSDELLETLKESLDSHNLEYLKVSAIKAAALQMLKNYDGAIELYREVHVARKKALGPGHSDTLMVLDQIGTILYEQGKYEESLATHREAMDVRKTYPGHSNLNVLKTFQSIGHVFFARGQHFEAYNTFKTILGHMSDILGTEHPEVTTIRQIIELIERRYQLVFPDGLELLHVDAPAGGFKGVRFQDLLGLNAADLRRRDAEGRTALHHFVSRGDEASVRLLLRRGVEVLEASHKGNTPLHVAARRGFDGMAELLLRHVSRACHWQLQGFVDAGTCGTCTTALHVATTVDVARVLLSYGATHDASNNDGATPRAVSRVPGVVALLRLVEECFARARRRDAGVVDVLWSLTPEDFRALAGARNREGNTLSHVARRIESDAMSSDLLAVLERRGKMR